MMQLDTDLQETTTEGATTQPQEWTQERLSNLVGLSEVPQDDQNVISQAEFFGYDEDPHENQSKRGFSSSPWAKGGLVFGVIGVGCLVFGFMLTDIFNGSSRSTSKPENSPTEPVVFEEDEPNQEGHLKTQLALDDQAERMKEIEDSRSPKTKLELDDVGEDKTPSPSSVESSSRRSVPRSSSPPPKTVRVPVRTETGGISSRLPRESRVGGTSPPQSSRSISSVRPVEPLSGETVEPKPVERVEQYDPLERLAMLQSLGSYGGSRRRDEDSQQLGGRLASLPSDSAVQQGLLPSRLVSEA
jgi:hypothetical protein